MRCLKAVEVNHNGPICDVMVPGGFWDLDVANDLVAVATDLVENRDVRVIVLRASDPNFCSGLAPGFDPSAVKPDPASMWARLRPPVVSVSTGRCRSVGFELMLATDITIGDAQSSFALDDVLVDNRLPCWGGTQRLPRAVRQAEAVGMMLLGTCLDGTKAFSLGLVHLLADQANPAQELADRVAQELAGRGPLSLELAKEAVHRGSELPLRDGLRLEGDLNHQLAATQDRAEGLAAFFDKRPPDFSGR